MKSLREILKEMNLPEVSENPDLAAFEDIELTAEEVTAAILQAKRIKKSQILEQQRRERAEENRRLLTETNWSKDVVASFAIGRAAKLFNGKFRLDKYNEFAFNLLCSYFANDPEFVETAKSLGYDDFSIDKGILLAGDYGTGKTWIMQAFVLNKRQCFAIQSAKAIAEAFHKNGPEALDVYEQPFKLAVNDRERFFQPFQGLCIDDLGAEEVKNNFGNRSNVIGDLIELKYSAKTTGPLFHATTNLNAAQIGEFYGGRVASRMREIFNILVLPGEDRRK